MRYFNTEGGCKLYFKSGFTIVRKYDKACQRISGDKEDAV